MKPKTKLHTGNFALVLPNGMTLNVEVTQDTISVTGIEKGQSDARVFYGSEIDFDKSSKQTEVWVQTWPTPETQEHVDDLLKSVE